MKQISLQLPPFAPDYSGACSALFELGGMIVIHDACGCTGNYTGFDEPRWYDGESQVYCSALRQMDAIMGDDEKLIGRVLDVYKRQGESNPIGDGVKGFGGEFF